MRGLTVHVEHALLEPAEMFGHQCALIAALAMLRQPGHVGCSLLPRRPWETLRGPCKPYEAGEPPETPWKSRDARGGPV